jgi:hypothetical protein
MPGDTENILSLEKFYGMLISVDCTKEGVTLQFKDDETFAYAKRVWDWVNGADDHSFVMVAGAGDCGMNEHRQPFLVSKLAYDEDQNIAHLTADPKDWQAIAHTYNLTVGDLSMPEVDGLKARDVTKDLSLDVSTSFPFSFKVTEDGLSSQLECSDCGTTGHVQFELKVSTVLFIPTGASMKLSPKSVSAKAQIKWTESGELTKSKTFKKTIVSIPLESITIPGGIVDIGPNLDIDVGFEISAISGSASISSGATVSLSDSAIVEINLLNPSENKFSGWTPSVNPIPVTVDAKISGGIAIFAQPSLKLVAEAIGKLAVPSHGRFHL